MTANKLPAVLACTAAAVLALSACSGQPSTPPAPYIVSSPVPASSSAAAAPVSPVPADVAEPIAARIRDGIWPALTTYRDNHFQAGAPAAQFARIRDPQLSADAPGARQAYDQLRTAAQNLGHPDDFDDATDTELFAYDARQLTVTVTAADQATATAAVCYMFALHSRNLDTQDTKIVASTARIDLHLVRAGDTWYLHAMTGDHRVPNC